MDSSASGRGIADLRGKPCVFCDILEGRAEGVLVFKDEDFAAIMDRYPLNLGHVLVMPREHYHHLLEMPQDRFAQLFMTVHRVAEAVHRATSSDGLGIGQNNGTAAAQVIPHVHVHIVPRYHGDIQEGRWLSRKQVSLDDLRAMAEGIRQAMEVLSASAPPGS